MKSQRQTKILEIIVQTDIETQDDLQKALQKAGFTQRQLDLLLSENALRLFS